MRGLASALIILALAYVALTAYAGFRVARGIDQAKASSAGTRVGASMIGRDAVEQIAIRKGNVPHWITRAPTFWMALRANE
jgi:hypothetical protein